MNQPYMPYAMALVLAMTGVDVGATRMRVMARAEGPVDSAPDLLVDLPEAARCGRAGRVTLAFWLDSAHGPGTRALERDSSVLIEDGDGVAWPLAPRWRRGGVASVTLTTPVVRGPLRVSVNLVSRDGRFAAVYEFLMEETCDGR